MLKKQGTYIVVRILPPNNIHITIMNDGEWCVMFTLVPTNIDDKLMLLLITDIKLPVVDTTSLEFISILGCLSTLITQMGYVIERCCGLFNETPVKFGMRKEDAPYAFSSTDAFFDSLRMEELLFDEDDIYFEIVDDTENIDGIIVLTTDGIHSIHDVFIPDPTEAAYLWN